MTTQERDIQLLEREDVWHFLPQKKLSIEETSPK